MIEQIENPVIEDITENIEETIEETPVQEEIVEEKKYTDKEVDELISKRLARQESKLRKEYANKYGKLESVLSQGTGIEDIEELTNTFNDFYTKRGIQIKDEPKYSDRDNEVLANAEAEEIISYGYEDIKEEVDRLANVGLDNMTPREKIVFKKLADERQRLEDEKELRSIGVTELDDKYKEFAKQLNPNLSTKEKYELYLKYNPKEKHETIGSMVNQMPEAKVKDFYTFEEASRITEKEYLANPKLMDIVQNSMSKW